MSRGVVDTVKREVLEFHILWLTCDKLSGDFRNVLGLIMRLVTLGGAVGEQEMPRLGALSRRKSDLSDEAAVQPLFFESAVLVLYSLFTENPLYMSVELLLPFISLIKRSC